MKTLGPPTAKDVLDFWLGDGLERGWCSDARDELWFGGGPELDASIQARFGTLVEQAIAGGLREWEDRIDTRLALVLDDHVSFVLGEDLVVRKFKLLDGAVDELESTERDDMRAELDARFLLMSAEVRRLFTVLEGALKLSKTEAA